MQDLIEESIRWIGYFALRAATLRRYRDGAKDDRLHEGAVGLAIVAAVAYATYALGSR